MQCADSNEVTINACLDYLYILLYALHYILAIWCQVTNAILLVVLVAAQKSWCYVSSFSVSVQQAL